MDSANSVELEDYTSSSDEMETPPRRPPPQLRKSPNDPDFNIYSNRKAEKREKEMQFWYTYIRAYVPLMKLMLEEYKIKWESCQFRKYAKDHNPDTEDMDDDSDTSNGSVTSCIDMGFPNGDMKPTAEISSGKGNIRNGLYMFLSYVRGGWFYPEVKQFFRKELGVRCFRTPVVNNALKGPDDFRAMMKFKTDKARAGVFAVLCQRDMLRNFTFVCIGCYCELVMCFYFITIFNKCLYCLIYKKDNYKESCKFFKNFAVYLILLFLWFLHSDADESYFQDSVIENLRNTKGLQGLPRCCVTFKDKSLM